MDFYDTTAQVIPILLLAIVWEGGYLERLNTRPDPRFWTKTKVRWWVTSMSLAAVVGEATMMLVLAGSFSAGVGPKVIGGIALAGLLATILVRLIADIRGATKPAAWPPELASHSESVSTANELERVRLLHRDKGLTDDEFAAAKQKILSLTGRLVCMAACRVPRASDPTSSAWLLGMERSSAAPVPNSGSDKTPQCVRAFCRPRCDRSQGSPTKWRATGQIDAEKPRAFRSQRLIAGTPIRDWTGNSVA